jgi:hypothetical protein
VPLPVGEESRWLVGYPVVFVWTEDLIAESFIQSASLVIVDIDVEAGTGGGGP